MFMASLSLPPSLLLLPPSLPLLLPLSLPRLSGVSIASGPRSTGTPLLIQSSEHLVIATCALLKGELSGEPARRLNGWLKALSLFHRTRV